MKLALLLLFLVSALAVETMLFNTGVNTNGNVRNPAGMRPEIHWEIATITMMDNTPVTVIPGLITWTASNGFPIGPYLGDNGVSQWIVPDDNRPYGIAGATYRFRTKFDLTDYDVSKATVVGKRACDDTCQKIRLNGDAPATNPGMAGFDQFYAFEYGIGHLVQGVNSLTIDVVNGPTNPTMNPVALRVEVFILGLASSADVVTNAASVKFFNTGVDEMGVPLLLMGTNVQTNLAPDNHYTLHYAPPLDARTPKIVTARRDNGHNTFPFPFWLADNDRSDWIGISTGSDDITSGTVGTYQFDVNFDMTDLSTYKAKIIGVRSCDDSCGPISINGGPPIFANVLSDSTIPPYTTWRTFVIDDGFMSGVNTLRFWVTNAFNSNPMNPVGLRVEMAMRATGCHNCVVGAKYVTQTCNLATFPSGQAQCTDCSVPDSSHYTNAVCMAGDYKTSMGTDTDIKACSEPTGSQRVTAQCMSGTATSMGTDTGFGMCSGPDGSQYVSTVCNQGTHAMIGMDTMFTTCSDPTTKKFVSTVCQHGSYNSAGTNTQFGDCCDAPADHYVSAICVAGDHNTKGKQTKTKPCCDPQSGQYVNQICMAGDWDTQGSDTTFNSCDTPGSGEWVMTPCMAGSHTMAGVNTVVKTCTAPTGNQYVSQACNAGSYNSGGTDTQFGMCTGPAGGYYVKKTCKVGTVNSAGHNTQTAQCTVCTSAEIHPCEPGTATQKGKNTVCADPCETDNGGCGAETCVRTGNDQHVCIPYVGAPCERDVDCPSSDLFCFNAHCFVNLCHVAPPSHCQSCMPTGNKKYRCCAPNGYGLIEE